MYLKILLHICDTYNCDSAEYRVSFPILRLQNKNKINFQFKLSQDFKQFLLAEVIFTFSHTYELFVHKVADEKPDFRLKPEDWPLCIG